MGGMNLIHLAAGFDFGTVFWFVVIAVFIISQIVKSRKQFNESAPDQQKPSDAAGDPAEELRKFLEGLSKPPEQQQAPQAPAAPPPPAPQRRIVPPKPRRSEAKKGFAPAAVSAFRAEPPPKHRPEPVPEPDEAAVLARYRAEMAASHATPVRSTSRWRTVLEPELLGKDRNALRKAFLLREILGAPTALRRREVVYPLV
jgi:hypothetical protein